MIKKSIIIFFVVVFVGCESGQISNLENDFQPTIDSDLYSVSGKIIPIFDYEDKSNIEIILTGVNNQRDTTDNEGNFLFENVDEGNYQIIVNYQKYSDIDININIIVDTNLALNIAISDYFRGFDFFPLDIGTELNFKYMLHGSYMEHHYYQNGNLSWMINDRTIINDEIHYSVEGSIIGTTLTLNWMPGEGYDSVYSSIEEKLFEFTIIELDDSLTIPLKYLSIWFIGDLPQEGKIRIPRYNYSIDNTLKVHDRGNFKVYLRKYEGLNYFYYGIGGNYYRTTVLERIYP